MKDLSKSIKIFLAYILVIVSLFSWAGISGTRLLGDGKEVFEPDGKPTAGRYHRGGTTYIRSSRYYHK